MLGPRSVGEGGLQDGPIAKDIADAAFAAGKEVLGRLRSNVGRRIGEELVGGFVSAR
jgi:hypothetical protein